MPQRKTLLKKKHYFPKIYQYKKAIKKISKRQRTSDRETLSQTKALKHLRKNFNMKSNSAADG